MQTHARLHAAHTHFKCGFNATAGWRINHRINAVKYWLWQVFLLHQPCWQETNNYSDVLFACKKKNKLDLGVLEFLTEAGVRKSCSPRITGQLNYIFLLCMSYLSHNSLCVPKSKDFYSSTCAYIVRNMSGLGLTITTFLVPPTLTVWRRWHVSCRCVER